MFYPYKNEVLFFQNKIIAIKNQYNIAKCTVKIEIQINNNNFRGSGFFLKFERYNNKTFYCLMTNQHVITSDLIKNKIEIQIKYENEKKHFPLKLDEEERIIIGFKKELNLDVAIVEIIPKDKVENSYFLTPRLNPIDQNKNIQTVQYPLGNYLSISKGKIVGIECNNIYYFYHTASTQPGSSGSPIVLENEEEVLAIHKGATQNQNFNVGIFIGIIVEMMKEYKKNGRYKEYYENGNLKYVGNFKDDEYDDDIGQFYFENGEIYTGQFKNGKKHGRGFIVDKDYNLLKEDIEYENDIEKVKEPNNEESNLNQNKVNIYPENKEEEKVEENKNELANNIVNILQNEEVKDFIRQAASKFKPVGDSLGMTLCECQHILKSHEEIEAGKYKCKECPEDRNTCYLLI